MPNPKTKRTLVLQSSVNTTAVATLNVTMDASFTTNGTTSNKFEDVSDPAVEEKTKYQMKFLTGVGGAEIGRITLRLVGNGDPTLAGVSVAKTARSEIDPAAGKGAVTLIDLPDASFERIWKQATLDGANVEAVDNINKLDMRVKAGTGYTVGQTVQTQNDNELVIAYAWYDPNGVPAVSGTVTLSSQSTPGTGYHLGIVRVTDNNPTTGEERRR